MNRILLIALLLSGFFASTEAEIKYSGAGAGFQLGLVIADTWNDFLPAAAFGFGAQGLVEIDFGKIGKAQYLPSLTFWFRADKPYSAYWNEKYKYRDGMVAINFLDLKYLPPIKESVIVRPYVGFGPAVVIHTGGYEFIHVDSTTGIKTIDENSSSDADAAFNFFLGVDFEISKVLAPFIEFRGVLSDKNVFKINVGANILF